MWSERKLDRSRSNIGPGPRQAFAWEKIWKKPPKSARSETTNGTRSIRISLLVSRTLAIGNDWATEWPNEYATIRAIGVPGVAVA